MPVEFSDLSAMADKINEVFDAPRQYFIGGMHCTGNYFLQEKGGVFMLKQVVTAEGKERLVFGPLVAEQLRSTMELYLLGAQELRLTMDKRGTTKFRRTV